MTFISAWQPSTSTVREAYRTRLGVLLAAAAALTMSACGGNSSPSAETSAEQDGASAKATKTTTAAKPVNRALYAFAYAVQSCSGSDPLEDDETALNASELVINNPQFGETDLALIELAVVRFRSGVRQDAWVMPDVATAQRAEKLLAPFGTAESANGTVRADTTVIAFHGPSAGVVEDCVVKARSEMTRRGISLADAGQRPETNVPQLTAADKKAVAKADLVATYCIDSTASGESVTDDFPSRAAVQQAVRRLLPVVRRFPSATVRLETGDYTVFEIAEQTLDALKEKPSCLTSADRAALKMALKRS